jgi:hypothetical protein
MLASFLEGLAALTERTGVGIHADQAVALDAQGRRFPLRATCRDDGSFTYALELPSITDAHRTASGETP